MFKIKKPLMMIRRGYRAVYPTSSHLSLQNAEQELAPNIPQDMELVATASSGLIPRPFLIRERFL
jgi:hypothetical protein